ncbi:MAG: Uma2 family endonuclease [Treponema sp.]|nr:Uma2 family endonuclease [Treponema sp.]
MADRMDVYEDELSLVAERYEFINGAAYAMSSPSAVHQFILLKTAAQLDAFFHSKPCTPYTAPFDVYPLADKGDMRTLVQPDILVVCDTKRLKMDGYYGPPPLLIEILSQNRSHDLVAKLALYHKAGVTEYLVIDPDYKIVLRFTWGEDAYSCNTFPFGPAIPSRYFAPLSLDLSFPLPFEDAAERPVIQEDSPGNR